MKLTLTTDEGVVLDQWRIEQEWGDISRDLPAAVMLIAIVERYRIAKAADAGEPAPSTEEAQAEPAALVEPAG